MIPLLLLAAVLGAWAMLSLFSAERWRKVQVMEMHAALERQQQTRSASKPGNSQTAGSSSDVVVVPEPEKGGN